MTISTYIHLGIISASALQDLLNADSDTPNIAVLDATFYMPSDPKNAQTEFKNAHIPGAQFFDIDHDFADTTSPLPHMLCNSAKFSEKMSALGISNDDLVVVYGQTGIIMGPARAWWSLKAFGHHNVVVLDGGLPTWIKAGLPLESGEAAPRPKTNYKPPSAPLLLSHIADVQNESGLQILDARPAPRFSGAAPEPREGLKRGHIPGSINIPCAGLVDPETGELKPRPALQALFKDSGYKAGEQTILTCGSGVTACALALALHNMNEENWRVYDGSWSEWGRQDLDNPTQIDT